MEKIAKNKYMKWIEAGATDAIKDERVNKLLSRYGINGNRSLSGIKGGMDKITQGKLDKIKADKIDLLNQVKKGERTKQSGKDRLWLLNDKKKNIVRDSQINNSDSSIVKGFLGKNRKPGVDSLANRKNLSGESLKNNIKNNWDSNHKTPLDNAITKHQERLTPKVEPKNNRARNMLMGAGVTTGVGLGVGGAYLAKKQRDQEKTAYDLVEYAFEKIMTK